MPLIVVCQYRKTFVGVAQPRSLPHSTPEKCSFLDHALWKTQEIDFVKITLLIQQHWAHSMWACDARLCSQLLQLAGTAKAMQDLGSPLEDQKVSCQNELNQVDLKLCQVLAFAQKCFKWDLANNSSKVQPRCGETVGQKTWLTIQSKNHWWGSGTKMIKNVFACCTWGGLGDPNFGPDKERLFY